MNSAIAAPRGLVTVKANQNTTTGSARNGRQASAARPVTAAHRAR